MNVTFPEKKLVSVIITTHNRAPKFVIRALNSVFNQTYKKLQIIVVDDSTPDYPLRSEVEFALRQFMVNNAKDIMGIMYIKHTTNQGACAARNIGLIHAKGYYVAFLDDDDEWFPEKIEEQLTGFTDNHIAFVYCGCVVINEMRSTKYLYSTIYKKGNIFYSLLDRNYIGGTSNPLIKKVCIEKIGGFDINMRSAQDYDLWLQLTLHYPVNYIKKPLLNYYEHCGERISTDIDGKIAGAERINMKYNQYVVKNNRTWSMRQRALIPLYLKKGWKKKAYKLWFSCVQKDPLCFLQNGKQLLLIIFGYDSLLYQAYSKIQRLA